MKKVLFIAAVCFALFGCKETPQVENPLPDAIEVTPGSVTFDAEGGSADVIITSTGEWTLTPAAEYDWVSASKVQGVDGDIITFTAVSNYEADKKADFTFATGAEGTATATFTVYSYAGKIPAVELLSPDSAEFAHEGGQLEIVVSTEETYYRDVEYTLSDGAEEWLAYQATLPGDVDTDAKFYFNVAALEGLADRNATVTVSAPGLAPVEVEVAQFAKHVLYTASSKYTVAVEGETIYIPVTANVEYSITMEGAEGWLTYGEATEQGVPFTAAALHGGKRAAEVTLVQTDAVEGETPLTCSFTITQVDALITWAAEMTGNRLFPKWDGAAGGIGTCSQFTLETLVRFDNFDKSSGSIFTIMGIEGQFLLRMGDVGNPLTRLQIATIKGNYNVPVDLEANRWYHIAVTFDSGLTKVYYDGVLAGEYTFSSWIGVLGSVNLSPEWSYEPSGNRCFWMGYSYESDRDTYGQMTEIRMWKKTLTEEEINAENHFYRVDPTSEGLFAYWPFTAGEGEFVEDATGNGNKLYGELNVTKQSNGDNVGTPGIEWVQIALPDK